MGIKYFNSVREHIKDIFINDVIVENSDLLTPSPFKSLFLPRQNIVFHLVSLNAPILSTLDKNFFYEWANYAEKQGIHPIHIWEDHWLNQKEIILSQLTSLAKKTKKVFARNTIAQRITQPQANNFLNANHLGGSPNARYKYGLIHKKTKELLAVATFSAPRKFVRENKSYKSYELIRFGSTLNTTVTGGLSKLLKTFIDDVQPDDIMTYTDRDWWTGRSYQPLGFKKIELMPPIELWINPIENKRFTKKQITPNEKRNCLKAYNSGSKKFLLTLK